MIAGEVCCRSSGWSTGYAEFIFLMMHRAGRFVKKGAREAGRTAGFEI
jgi:hypothetical protein